MVGKVWLPELTERVFSDVQAAFWLVGKEEITWLSAFRLVEKKKRFTRFTVGAEMAALLLQIFWLLLVYYRLFWFAFNLLISVKGFLFLLYQILTYFFSFLVNEILKLLLFDVFSLCFVIRFVKYFLFFFLFFRYFFEYSDYYRF